MSNRERRIVREMKKDAAFRTLQIRAARAIESWDVVGRDNTQAADRLLRDIFGEAG